MNTNKRFWALLFSFPAAALLCCTAGQGEPRKLAVLRVGSTGTLTGNPDSPKEKVGLATLEKFIRDETGLNNQIHGQQKWNVLAQKLAKGDLDVGVFQGYEYA